MSRRSEARARQDAGEPRWVERIEEESAPPSSGPFAHTYAAIAATEGRRRGRHRPYGLFLLIALAGAAAAVIVPLLTDDPPEHVATPAVRAVAQPRPTSESGSAAPTVVDAAPSSPKTRLRVDEPGDFAVVARGGNLRYGWTLDGQAAGTGPRWVWTPEAGDVGTHTVAVTVLGPGGGITREWKVRVRPAPSQVTTMARAPVAPPAAATPAPPVVQPEPAPPAPATPSAPPAPTAQPAAPAPPPAVAAPPAPPSAPVEMAARPPARREPSPPRADDEDDTAPAIASRTDDAGARRRADDARASRRRAAPPEQTARAEGARGTSADVRRWLQRWAAAWNAHDIEALRRMGQMATASDAEAVRRYLAQVTDLEVSVNVVEMHDEGERVVVTFVRRDRFRDPAGRLVEHESPPIEKTLVRTADGFRVVQGRS
jgi:hypothetical protein